MRPADYERALRVLRRNMPPGLRSVYDPEDFVQQACLEVIAEGLDSSLLTHIAMHRMLAAHARPDRWRRISDERLVVEAESAQPTAQENLDAVELRERLIALADCDEERAIIALALEGWPRPEIAARVGYMPGAVQQFLANLTRKCPTTS